MKTLNSDFQTALSSETTTLAWCWLIQRQDGINLGFTSFDLFLAIDNVPYSPVAGFNPSAVSTSEGLENSDNQNLASVFNSDDISAEDLIAGKYESATIVSSLWVAQIKFPDIAPPFPKLGASLRHNYS